LGGGAREWKEKRAAGERLDREMSKSVDRYRWISLVFYPKKIE
jgi:hypothetical protein